MHISCTLLHFSCTKVYIHNEPLSSNLELLSLLIASLLFIFHIGSAGMDTSQIHLWHISFSVSDAFQRGLICKSLRRLSGAWLRMSPQRRLWDLSGISQRCLWVAFDTVVLGLQSKTCSSKAWLPVNLTTSLNKESGAELGLS